MLYRSKSSTNLHQTGRQGRLPGDVVIYCFCYKSKIVLFAKPEVELIFSTAAIEKKGNVDVSSTVVTHPAVSSNAINL